MQLNKIGHGEGGPSFGCWHLYLRWTEFYICWIWGACGFSRLVYPVESWIAEGRVGLELSSTICLWDEDLRVSSTQEVVESGEGRWFYLSRISDQRERGDWGLKWLLISEIINQQLQILFIVDTALGVFPMDRLWLTSNHECQKLDIFCKEILPKARCVWLSPWDCVCSASSNSW